MVVPAVPQVTPVEALAALTKRTWPAIADCKSDSDVQLQRIREALDNEKLIPSDCSFVAFGSLARNEFAPGAEDKGSDVDWTLLINGAADPKHLDDAQGIAKMLKALGFKSPGSTAVFGGLAFSHELVHLIGGDGDTNRNLTRRILLLLESRMVREQGGVREGVLRSVMTRYLQEDRGYHEANDLKVKVPRFLLNDVARFWRTMAVDYAAKRREREWSGWAIRNIKLRLSRKLIYVSGLAMCLSCELMPSENLTTAQNEAEFHAAMLDFMLQCANRTPLEVLAQFSLDLGLEAVAAEIFTHYDAFLAILRHPDKRAALENMDFEAAMTAPLFKEARAVGTAFQEALNKLFFQSENRELTQATQRYGVF